jgi:hypothetical protein
MLRAETDEHGGALDSYCGRARSIVLLTVNSPAFANVLAQPGTRAEKVRRQGRNLAEVTQQLRYLERLYPSSIGEACFIDADGEEFARVVRGEIAAPDELSTQEEQTPFFSPTFAMDIGQTHQTRPYVSPETKEWVIANAKRVWARWLHEYPEASATSSRLCPRMALSTTAPHIASAWLTTAHRKCGQNSSDVRLADEPFELVQHVESEVDEWQYRGLGVPDGFAECETCDDVGDVVLAKVDDGEGQQAGAAPGHHAGHWAELR